MIINYPLKNKKKKKNSLIKFIFLNIIPHLKKAGNLALLFNSHPAQCNKLTAGKMGPTLSLASVKATPHDSPFEQKDKVII